MKIKLLSPICGNKIVNGKVVGDFAHRDGAIIDWNDNEAKKLIDKGYAEPAPVEQKGAK